MKRFTVVKILVLFLALFSFLVFSRPRIGLAYEQTEDICYSQCAAYEFFWQGNACWDFIEMNCGMSRGALAIKVATMLKDVVMAVVKNAPGSVDNTIFRALFCAAMINECVAPELEICRSTCQNYPLYYAPNIVADSPWSGSPGIFYSKNDHKLYFRVTNDGAGYAWNIKVKAEWGHTPERDGVIDSFQPLFEEEIAELLFLGSQQSSPKGLVDTVKDFLVDESNFSGFLSKYKSDAGQEYIPPVWLKEMPFTATAGELTQVVLTVDPDNEIPETDEADNVYVLEIDDRPTPARFQITRVDNELVGDDLIQRRFTVNFNNLGEEAGTATIKIYRGSQASGTPLVETSMEVGGKETGSWQGIVSLDLAGETCGWNKKFRIEVGDPFGGKSTYLTDLNFYIGSVSGTVQDSFGNGIEGVAVKSSLDHEVITNKYGSYWIKGITRLGKLTLTASRPGFNQESVQEVEIKILDKNISSCLDKGLQVRRVNFVLSSQPAKVTFKIRDSEGKDVSAQILLTNENFRYQEDVDGQKILEIEAGKYNLTISSFGYYSFYQEIGLVSGEQTLEFTLEKFAPKTSDEGLAFIEPKLLWQKKLQRDKDREDFFVKAAASKDGHLLVIYTLDAHPPSKGRLYFIDSLSGEKKKTFDLPLGEANKDVALDASWDGRTVAFYRAVLAKETNDPDRRNVLQLFNASGEEFLNRDFDPGATDIAEVSPDGFYIYVFRLMNSSGYIYSRRDILGDRGSKEQEMTYTSGNALHFLISNFLVSRCQENTGNHCLSDIQWQELTPFPEVTDATFSIDSSANTTNIVMQTLKKIFYYRDGNLVWERDSDSHSRDWVVSMSPGGKYVIGLNQPDQEKGFVVYDESGEDVTLQVNGWYTQFVTANEGGIFYLKEKPDGILEYYQLAVYPQTTSFSQSSAGKRATPAAAVVVGMVVGAGAGVVLAKAKGIKLAELGKKFKKTA